MTLIIAADAQDHLILAGDHCAVLSRVSNQGAPDLVLDNYRKVYPWKYGAIAASGDVFLMAYFCRLFLYHAGKGGPISPVQIARAAKQTRSGSGTPLDRSTGNIFFTLPGREGFDLHCVFIGADRVDHEVIKPISTRFSVGKKMLDEPAYDEFGSRLRPSFFFNDIDGFHRHHLDLLTGFFAEQSTADELVTASFDVCMLDKRTGVGKFWSVSETPKQLAFIELPADESSAGREVRRIEKADGERPSVSLAHPP